MQSSLAVRASGGPWYLINASPDIRQQLEMLRDPADDRLRSNPIAGVILTDAELDHTAGLLILRESGVPLQLHGTARVEEALTVGYPLLQVLERYSGFRWNRIEAGRSFELGGDGSAPLEIEVFSVPGDAPLYMRGREGASGDGYTIGLSIREGGSDRVVTYVPGLARIDDELLERFARSELLLLDGTFWSEDELPGAGIGTRSASDMGHLPLSGAGGTLERLRHLDSTRKIFVHINNTNPILIEDSPERHAVIEAAFEVGRDGMLIDL